MKAEQLKQPNFLGSTAPAGWGRHVLLVVALTAVISGLLVAAATGSAAAADSADATVAVQNGTDINDSGPLPDGLVGSAQVIVSNQSGDYSTSDVSISGVSVSKSTSNGDVIAEISESDLPDSGSLTVDVSVGGTLVESVSASKVTYATDSTTVNESKLSNVDNVSVTVDVSDIESDDYLTVDAPVGSPDEGSWSLTLSSDTGRLPAPGFAVDEAANGTVTKTINRSDLSASDQDQFDRFVQDSGNNTFYFPNSVEELQINEDTVYESGILGGGGGGGGSNNQTLLIGLGVVVLALLLAIRD